MTDNALNSLFRQQSYYLSLPSGGKYYKTAPQMSADNELGLMPMSAVDEIKLKSPDALFNGDGLYDLFKSCVPGIADPKEIPAIDLDAILIGIRLAAGEETASMSSTCPECSKVEPYDVDLNEILLSIRPKSLENELTIRGDVRVVLNPITLAAQVKTQIEAFYQMQMQKALSAAEDDFESNQAVFEKALSSAIELQVSQLADCICSVTVKSEDSDVTVSNPDHILEWVKNMTKDDHREISDRIKLISSTDIINKMSVKCPGCDHEYSMKIELNPANFF